MALALYRKYRPRTFAEVIGQEHVTEPLSQALRSGRLHHAYLFSGPRGCGKTSSARILARSLNCEQGPTPEPCGVCGSCRSLANDGAGSIDVIEIDAASHGGVDDARELREKAFFAPASSRYKIYVIDEAHMVSSAGFNALLKLVEEPPDYVKFIFATTEPEKVLGTIRSRTHHYPFRLIPPAVLRPYLQQLTEAEGVHVEPAVLPLVVRAGGGSARDTLSVLDQLIAGAGPEGVSYTRAVALLGVTDVSLIDEMCDALAAGDGAAAYTTIDRVAEAGHDPRRFASDLLERLRDLIVLQQVPDAVTKGLIDGPADQLETMAAQAARLGPATLSRCADIVHNGLVEMRGTTAPRLLLELITARMLLPGAEDSTGALLQRLERMERRLTLGGDESLRPDVTQPAAPTPVSSAPVDASGSASGGGLSAARAAAAAARRSSSGAASKAGGSGVADSAGPAADRPGADSSGPKADAGGPVGAATAGARSGDEAAAVPDLPVAAAPAAPAAQTESPSDTAQRAGTSRGAAPETGGSPGEVPNSDAAWPTAVPDHDEPPPWDEEPEESYPVGEESRPVPQVPAARSAEPSSAAVEAPSAPGVSAPAEASSAPAVAPSTPAAPAPAPAPAPAAPAPAARRAEPAGVLPDAPEEPGAAAVAELPGQLTVAAVREVWPEIVTAIRRQPNGKVAGPMVAGAVVRALDGETVVLVFQFANHAERIAREAALVTNALYETLGGNWSIRCEVGGRDGGESPARRNAPAGGGRATERNDAPRASTARAAQVPRTTGGAQQASARAPQDRRPPAEAPPASDDDWPEPARPGGSAAATVPQATPDSGSGDEDWPEVRPIGVPPSGPAAAGDDRSISAGDSAGGRSAVSGLPAGGAPTPGPSGAAMMPDQSRSTAPDSSHVAAPGANVVPGGHAAPGGNGAAAAEAGATAPAIAGFAAGGGDYARDSSVNTVTRSAEVKADGVAGPSAGNGSVQTPGRSAELATNGGPAETALSPDGAGAAVAVHPGGSVAGTAAAPGARSVGSGLAAARAAAAGARNAAAARQSGKPAAAAAPASWSDGSPTEEAPYDPDFDGPSSGGAAAIEGFDPGDEPLDDVIDEKTARESGEQKAMRLLQDILGAEKIGES